MTEDNSLGHSQLLEDSAEADKGQGLTARALEQGRFASSLLPAGPPTSQWRLAYSYLLFFLGCPRFHLPLVLPASVPLDDGERTESRPAVTLSRRHRHGRRASLQLRGSFLRSHRSPGAACAYLLSSGGSQVSPCSVSGKTARALEKKPRPNFCALC